MTSPSVPVLHAKTSDGRTAASASIRGPTRYRSRRNVGHEVRGRFYEDADDEDGDFDVGFSGRTAHSPSRARSPTSINRRPPSASESETAVVVGCGLPTSLGDLYLAPDMPDFFDEIEYAPAAAKDCCTFSTNAISLLSSNPFSNLYFYTTFSISIDSETKSRHREQHITF